MWNCGWRNSNRILTCPGDNGGREGELEHDKVQGSGGTTPNDGKVQVTHSVRMVINGVGQRPGWMMHRQPSPTVARPSKVHERAASPRMGWNWFSYHRRV